MAWFAAAAAAAATLGSAAIKASAKNSGTEKETPGFHGSGWTNEQEGYTPGVQTSFPRTNEFLGSNIGKISTDVAGSFLGDYRQRRNSRNRLSDLKDQGLTPWEIAGGGGGGSNVPAQGNTLGSGPATQIASTQAFTASENAKNRALEKYKVDQQVKAPARQAGVSEGKLAIERIMSVAQFTVIEKTAEKIGWEIKQKELEYNSFWQILAAHMGPENLKMAAALFIHGINLEKMLKVLEPATDEEVKYLRRMWRDIHNENSFFYKEFHGLLSTAGKNILAPALDKIRGTKPIKQLQ